MSNTSIKVFDDRWLKAIGIPVIGFLVPILFFGESPAQVGWDVFLPSCFVSMLYTGTYWFLASAILDYWRQHFPDSTSNAKRIGYTIASQIIAVAIVEILCNFAFGWHDLLGNFIAEPRDHDIWQTMPISLLLVFSMTGIYEAIYFFTLFRQAELDKERLLRSQVENQLDALRKQVDPHFLFNSLNTLVSIIPENPTAAQEFTVRLSATYRRLLEMRHVSRVSLAQELEALDDYLHLLEVRYEGRLRIDLRIDPALSEYHIAPLALQLLVENAVKHNEASLSNPLVVEVYSEAQSITVSNLKRLKAKSEVDSTGFGLENLRDRVRFLNAQDVNITETDDRFSVSVPLLEMAPAPQLVHSKKAS
ncbi:MAG: sensor histidine kinase [Saprospiraceae bacterium]